MCCLPQLCVIRTLAEAGTPPEGSAGAGVGLQIHYAVRPDGPSPSKATPHATRSASCHTYITCGFARMWLYESGSAGCGAPEPERLTFSFSFWQPVDQLPRALLCVAHTLGSTGGIFIRASRQFAREGARRPRENSQACMLRSIV